MMYGLVLVVVLINFRPGGVTSKVLGNENKYDSLDITTATEPGVQMLAVDQSSKETSINTLYSESTKVESSHLTSKNDIILHFRMDGPHRPNSTPAPSDNLLSSHSSQAYSISKFGSTVIKTTTSLPTGLHESTFKRNSLETPSSIHQESRTGDLRSLLTSVQASESPASSFPPLHTTEGGSAAKNGSHTEMFSTSLIPNTTGLLTSHSDSTVFATVATSIPYSFPSMLLSSTVASSYEPLSTNSSSIPSMNCTTLTVCSWDIMTTAGVASSFLPASLSPTHVSPSLTMLPDVNSTSAPIKTSITEVSPSSWAPIITPSYSVISNQSDIQPIAKKGCDVILDGLATVMGRMTSCLIRSLRPLQICRTCTHLHSELKRYQILISEGCNQKLVLEYNAQYQAIPKIFKVHDTMWQDFECEKCYKKRADNDPKAPWIPKEEFIKTESLVKEMMICFANYTNEKIDLPYPVMLNVTEKSNTTSWKNKDNLCRNCEKSYRKLKRYMKSIHFEGSAEKRWCADMVYAFNETRRLWGKFCKSPAADQEPVIALTCFFCFLPVVFYVGTKLHSDVKERKNEARVNYESD